LVKSENVRRNGEQHPTWGKDKFRPDELCFTAPFFPWVSLREVLVGPMRFRPQGRSYHFQGEAALGRLLAGAIGDATNLVPVHGLAKGWTAKFTGIAA
jgi:hypothetical protein